MNNTSREHSPVSIEHLPFMRLVLQAFDIGESGLTIEPFGSGLINHTWKISTRDKSYILQRINSAVFHHPADIAYNIRLIAGYLAKYAPNYLFVTPISANKETDLVHIEAEGYFRLFPFVPDSITKNVVETPAQAYEAAAQFGKFTRLLSGFDASKLRITIPDFHNLSLRYGQFLWAIENGNSERIKESQQLINQLKNSSGIVAEYERIKANPDFKIRVTHHDTKISNVLFDKAGKGACVIDLDTVMPGYFFSDVGDMMRTYLSPVSEEEKDFDKICIRRDFYQAIVEGYHGEMKDELTEIEKHYFSYAGKFMSYMQALRFLTDHLNDDVYYEAKYEGHNLVRARNQVTLLEKLIEAESFISSSALY
jgi:Ser/Thr protein kinase RdoA (MazF antagonist)